MTFELTQCRISHSTIYHNSKQVLSLKQQLIYQIGIYNFLPAYCLVACSGVIVTVMIAYD